MIRGFGFNKIENVIVGIFKVVLVIEFVVYYFDKEVGICEFRIIYKLRFLESDLKVMLEKIRELDLFSN